MPNKVEIVMSADITGFSRGVDQATDQISKFIGLAEGLKGLLAGALGGFSIASIVTAMFDFAKNIDDASKRLGVTITEAYNLKRAAQEAGMEFEQMFKVRSKAEEFLQGVVNRNPVDLRLANQFGLTGQETWLQAVRALLTGGANRTQLGQLVGQTEANVLSSPENKKAFLDQSATIDEKAIKNIALAKNEFTEFAEELKSDLSPAFAFVMEILRKSMAFFKSSVDVLATTILTMFEAFKHPIEALNNPGKFLDTLGENIGDIQREFQAHESEIKARLNSPTAPPPDVREAQKQTVTSMESNPFLKVGGLLGTDVSFRLQRLQLNYVKETADNTKQTNQHLQTLISKVGQKSLSVVN